MLRPKRNPPQISQPRKLTLQSIHIEWLEGKGLLDVADEGGGVAAEGGGAFTRQIGAGGIT